MAVMDMEQLLSSILRRLKVLERRPIITPGPASAANLTGVVPVASGGTGASTAGTARTNLGLGALATLSDVDLASEVVGTLPIANGGTGAITASAARTALGITPANIGAVAVNAQPDIPWTNFTYLSGFTSGSAGQLRYCVVAGILYVAGGASPTSGNFADSTYTAVTGANLPTNLRPSSTWHYGADATGARTAFMQINTDGSITVGYDANGTGTAVSWISGSTAMPLGA